MALYISINTAPWKSRSAKRQEKKASTSAWGGAAGGDASQSEGDEWQPLDQWEGGEDGWREEDAFGSAVLLTEEDSEMMRF